jgi:hypothetical protein
MPITKPSQEEAHSAARELFDGQHGMGLIPNPPDPRDYLVASSPDAILPETLRHEIVSAPDLSRSFGVKARDLPPIWDQDGVGACAAYATDRLVCHARKRQGLPYVEPSHLFTYYNARALYGHEAELHDTGSAPSLCLESARKYGIAPATDWPFDRRKVVVKPSDAAYVDAELHQALSTWMIPDGDVAAVQASLMDGWPVMVGLPLFENFGTDEKGLVPGPKGSIRGYHEVTIRGWRPWWGGCLATDNQWTTAWGKRGRCFLPVSYVAEHGFAFGTVRAVENVAMPGGLL